MNKYMRIIWRLVNNFGRYFMESYKIDVTVDVFMVYKIVLKNGLLCG